MKIKSCLACQENGRDEPKQPAIYSLPPSHAWHTVAVDFFGPFEGIYLMVLYDLLSRYPLVSILNAIQCSFVKALLRELFSMFGINVDLISNNGPPFNSSEFSVELNFHHRRITPYWPQANGAAESFMINLGKVIRCASVEGKPWRTELVKFLANYRATPHLSTGIAPNDLIFRRANTSKLPSVRSLEANIDESAARRFDTERKSKLAQNSSITINKPGLQVGEQVLVKWARSHKSKPRFDPNPYTITTMKGTNR